MRYPTVFFALIFSLIVFSSAEAKGLNNPPKQTTASSVQIQHDGNRYVLTNEKIEFVITLENGFLKRELLRARAQAKSFFKNQLPEWQSDGNFAFDVNWTDWQAPHKINNADNPVLLTSKDFKLKRISQKNLKNGGKQLNLIFSGPVPFYDQNLSVKVSYRLNPGNFWVHKQLSISDSIFVYHFLRFIYPTYAQISGKFKIVKFGGFGQPVAMRNEQGGFFSGLEYPAATNTIRTNGNGTLQLKCGVEVGQKITAKGIESPWQVLALTPSHFERLWFGHYLVSQRVEPLRPYVLYNSWYDLRAPAFKNIPAKNIMNEANIMRIIDLIEKNFVQKNGIHLDAFVLDDGWDLYDSDWVLRPKQFPHGLKPIADRLKQLNTDLGLWFGPTGGYSFRMRRINWMGAHGYEVTAKHSDRNHAMMCVAGKHYSQLLKKRTTDFVRNDGVAFFKWDGIQFSCSEPDHGHPVGLYSRRAVMDTVISLCNAVRKENPNTYLNITSGTWLSPWWVKYANQIWMQGGDYGYSDLPSITQRDAAITYRDNTLFHDFNTYKFWFPIANLMTHGIIKGELQRLGGEQEPIDKFTDNALLYFARGVSMWELYISPDILSDAEWTAIAQSMKWARKNFDILKHSFMVGGNPSKGSIYAHVHFYKSRGIVAVRNPFITPQTIEIPLSDTLGLASEADQLVLEQIYPYRWISPKLYKEGDIIHLKANGYETAVYQIFPLKEAKRPLPANIVFSGKKLNDRQYQITAFATTGPLKMLNPNFSGAMHQPGKKAEHIRFNLPETRTLDGLKTIRLHPTKQGITAELKLKPESQAQLAMLLQSDSKNQAQALPQVQINLNGQAVKATIKAQKGKWAWIKVPFKTADNQLKITFKTDAKSASWIGNVQLWLVSNKTMEGTRLVFDTKKPVENEVLPPLPRAANQWHQNRLLAKYYFKNKELKPLKN